MAKLDLQDFADLDGIFSHIAYIPTSVTEQALDAMSRVAKDEIYKSGLAMGVFDEESDVHILQNIKLQKPTMTDSGGYRDITFSGSRVRNGAKTRNAEIAFVNEYGKRGQLARPFIGTAMEQHADKIAKPGAEILWDWVEKNF